MIIELLFFVFVLLQAVEVYLVWRIVPRDIKAEIQRKVSPPRSNVLSWKPEQDPDEVVFEDTLKNRTSNYK